MRQTKKNRLNASSQVVRRLQKMEENIFGAHAPNVELKKQNLLKPRETKSAPSRRGHFGCSSIHQLGRHQLGRIFFFNTESLGLVTRQLKWGYIMDRKL